MRESSHYDFARLSEMPGAASKQTGVFILIARRFSTQPARFSDDEKPMIDCSRVSDERI